MAFQPCNLLHMYINFNWFANRDVIYERTDGFRGPFFLRFSIYHMIVCEHMKGWHLERKVLQLRVFSHQIIFFS
jgi:hypothetical protein